MTLGFSTHWGPEMGELAGKPTYFVDKITVSLDLSIDQFEYYKFEYTKKTGKELYTFPGVLISPKPHTIRRGHRWKKGDKIHMVIHNRTKDRFQFVPVIECTGVQDIEISFSPTFDPPEIKVNKLINYRPYVNVDGNDLTAQGIEELATNDGFPSVESFFNFFDKDFDGQIVHWTDIRY